MENQSTDKTEIKLSYKSNDIEQSPITKLMDIVGNIRTVDTVPTHKPSDIVDQVLIYKNGTDKRLYYYDGKNDEWNYVTQTVAIQQYHSTVGHTTTSLSVVSYDDTITSTFTPHTVLFYGNYTDGTGNAITQGRAGVTAPTAGDCNYLFVAGGTQSGYNTSNLGYVSTNARVYVSAWNNDGVTLTTKLIQNGGAATLQGAVILIG